MAEAKKEKAKTIAEIVTPQVEELARKAAVVGGGEVVSADKPTFQVGGTGRSKISIRVHLKDGGHSDHVYDYDSATGGNIKEAIVK
jgi:hypothetical protein